MKKKFLLSFVLICIVVFAFGILCAYAGTEGYLSYTVSNGEVTITHCDKSATEVVVPETIEGCPVTAIGNRAFSNCIDLTSVKFPDSITSIGSNAFSMCSALTSVSIPSSVTAIDHNAFYKCTQLTSIIIHDSITSIGYDAFYDTGYYNNDDNWENGILYINNYLIKVKNTFCGVCHIKEGTLIISESALWSITSEARR